MRSSNALIGTGLAFIAAAALTAQQDTFTRDEKGYWTQVLSGTVSERLQPHLRVVSRGRIILKGTSNPAMTFRLKQQVPAHSEEEARRMIHKPFMAAQSAGDWTTFIVTPNSSPNVITELEVNVPRQMLLSVLESQWGGGIEAYDLDGSVQAVTQAGTLKLDRIKGNVLARTGGGEIRLGKIGGTVRCSSGAGSVYLESSGREANCATAGGDMVVGESGGPLVLSTEGGNIRVTKAVSTVEAHTGEGVIDVLQADGIVTADTNGGSIQVGSRNGVKAESGAGMVRVKSLAGPINLSAAGGSILAELLSGGRLQDSTLVTGGGDITVLIPSNLRISVMARTDMGLAPRIVSDFKEVHGNSTALFRPPQQVTGEINGGGPVVRLNASSGVIYLKRTK